MYTRLMCSALDKLASSSDGATTGQALAELLRCRNRLGARMSLEGSNRASAAIADELAYDIALIDLARLYGIECDVSDFDNPIRGRALLERGLGSRGVRVGGPGEETRPH